MLIEGVGIGAIRGLILLAMVAVALASCSGDPIASADSCTDLAAAYDADRAVEVEERAIELQLEAIEAGNTLEYAVCVQVISAAPDDHFADIADEVEEAPGG